MKRLQARMKNRGRHTKVTSPCNQGQFPVATLTVPRMVEDGKTLPSLISNHPRDHLTIKHSSFRNHVKLAVALMVKEFMDMACDRVSQPIVMRATRRFSLQLGLRARMEMVTTLKQVLLDQAQTVELERGEAQA